MTSAESQPLLVCTVGGSPQPVVTAVRELGPVFVCFLCTDRDPGTGQPGSRVQVERPSPPAIPTEAGLEPDAYELRVVPADEIDGVVEVALEVFKDLAERFPGLPITADYTGGTKTMTAGLILAALERTDVGLRLTTGARSDLERVHDGTEAGITALTAGVRLRRAMAPYIEAWEHYGYGASARGLARIPQPNHPIHRGKWQIAKDLSAAFDAWDRFDHQRAAVLLERYRPRIGQYAGQYAGRLRKFLQILCAANDEPRQEPARLLDLWLNASRRAAQGRYDDAVARAYRLLEWTAQWLLRTRANIDTAAVREDQVPADMVIRPGRDGRLQAGLHDAWRLVAHHLEGKAAEFAQTRSLAMVSHLEVRNMSILAHGFVPIDEAQWNRFAGWLEEVFLPVLRAAAAESGLRMDPPQLPQHPIWSQ